ncbi:hypothetical protein K1719_042164 [Acacia pycnantha]|nr:hypothetical protein K1719_042164 [Acacia pycnantha]
MPPCGRRNVAISGCGRRLRSRSSGLVLGRHENSLQVSPSLTSVPPCSLSSLASSSYVKTMYTEPPDLETMNKEPPDLETTQNEKAYSFWPKRVVILDSIRSQNYHGRLSSDEAFAFKMETAAKSTIGVDEKFLKGLEYYPSGSVVDGLSAALLGRCQILKIRGVLCVSWPEFDAFVVSL